MPRLMFLLSMALASGFIIFVGAYAACLFVFASSGEEIDGVTVIVAMGLSTVISAGSTLAIVLFLRNRI